jgi:hypothetical protein
MPSLSSKPPSGLRMRTAVGDAGKKVRQAHAAVRIFETP